MAYKLTPRNTVWVDLPDGVRLHVRIPISVDWIRAREEARGNKGDPAALQDSIVRALARETVIDWEGIDGNPEVTPEAISNLMDDFLMFEAFSTAVFLTREQRTAEKNA